MMKSLRDIPRCALGRILANGVAAGILPAVEPWLPARRQKTSAIHTALDIL
jgi:hypothetical protein